MSHTRPALPELMCDGKGCTKKSRSRAGHSVTKINGYIVCSDACERTLPSVPAGHIRRITSFQTNNGFWHHVEYAMPDAAEVRSANKTKDMLDAYSRGNS